MVAARVVPADSPRRPGVLHFLHHGIRDMRQTGAIAPSGAALAERMVEHVIALQGPRKILEVGPGTGPFTKRLLRELRSGDTLDVCERNERFCEHLDEAHLQAHIAAGRPGRIRLLREDILHATMDAPYDAIVCGLPFTNFPTALVHDIFARLLQALRPGGSMTFFRYAFIRAAQSPFVGHEGRARLRALRELERSLARTHSLNTRFVFPNVPPAVAVSVTRSTAPSASTTPWLD